MSSWLNLSGNISSNLSSITGHISNFTREVLTEGTEEIYDQEAELSIAKSKIRELEARVQNQKNEWDRINTVNEDLRDRAESAELQIRAMSGEYRLKLEEKENEIKQLKQSHADFIVDSPAHKSMPDSWLEGDDTENSLALVGQLQREIADLHADCKYWKDIANNKQNADADLAALKQEHEQRMTSLQTTYSQKVTKMKRKFKAELDSLQKEKEELERKVSGSQDDWTTGNSNDESTGDVETLKTSLKIAEDQHRALEVSLKDKEKGIDEVENQLQKERLENDINLKDKEDIIMSLDDEIRRLTDHNQEKDAKISMLEEEIVKLKDCVYSQEIESTQEEQVHKHARVSCEYVENGTQTPSLEDVVSVESKNYKIINDSLSHANDENVSLTLENNKLVEELELVSNERDALHQQAEEFELEKNRLIDAVQNAEVERDIAATERDRIEDSVKELEELRFDISKLESWTSELVEELELSKEVQDEQSFELESLRHICQLKGDPMEEIRRLRLNVKKLAEQHVDLFQQYKTVSSLLRDSNRRLLEECSLRHEHAKDVRGEIAKVRRKFLNSQESKLANCLDEKEKVEDRLVEISDQVCKQEDIVTELQLDSDYLSQETAAMVTDFGCQVDVNMENNIDTIESLRAEKAILERTIEGLERRAGTLEDLFADMHDKKRQSISRIVSQESKKRLTGQLSNEHVSNNTTMSASSDDPDRPSVPDKEQSFTPGKERAFSPCSVDSQDGSYFDDDQPRKLWAESDPKIVELEGYISDLMKKIQEYELCVTNMESKEREWTLEKSAMENVIIDLQKKVKNQEILVRKDSGSNGALSLVDSSSLLDVQVQNRGLETDLSMSDIDELLQLTTVNKELAMEIDAQRKLIISAEHCLIDVVDKLRKLVNDDVLNNPDFVKRLKSLSTDNHSSTLKRIEKVKYLVEVLSTEHCQNSALKDKEQELAVIFEDNEKLQNDLQNLQEETEKASENANILLQEKNSMSVLLDEARKGSEQLKLDLDDTVTERDELRLRMETLLDESGRKEADNLKEIQELKTRLEDVTCEMEQLTLELSARDDSILEQQENFDSMLDQVTDEKDRDLLELQEQQEQIMELYKAKQKEMEILTLEKQDAVGTAIRLEREVESINQKLNKSLHELKDRPSKKEVEDRDNTIRQLNDDLQQLEREKMQYVESASQQIESLEDQLKEEEEHVKQLEIRSLNFENEIGKNDDELMKFNDRIRTLESVLHEEREKSAIGDFKNQPEVDDVVLHDAAPTVKAPEVDTNLTSAETATNVSEEEVGVVKLFDVEGRVEESKYFEEQGVASEGLRTVHEIDDHVGQQKTNSDRDERIDRLGLEISSLTLSLEDRERTIQKLNEEMARFLNVIKTKDELLLDLQSADLEDANSESRQKIISYIRELEDGNQTLEDKVSSQDEMINHYENQLNLMKTDRESLLGLNAGKDQQLSDLSERLENVEARSQAKEHASSVLHQEHQKLLELNHSQGEEIAKLREKIQTLQISLEAKHDQLHQMIGIQMKSSELEKEVNAFQEEEERLLTLIHEKDNRLRSMEDAVRQATESRVAEELEALNSKCIELERQLHLAQQEINEHPIVQNERSQGQDDVQRTLVTTDNQSQTEKRHIPCVDKAVMCSLYTSTSEVNVEETAMQKYEDQLSSLNETLEHTVEEKTAMEAKLIEMKQLLDCSESEKMRLENAQQATLMESNRQISGLQKTVQDLKETQAKSNQSYEAVQKQIKVDFEQRIKLLTRDLESKIGMKEEELRDALKKIDLLNSVNHELKLANVSDDSSKIKLEAMQAELAKFNDLCKEQQNEVTSLREELNRYKNIVSASEAALEKTQEDNRQFKLTLEKKAVSISEAEQEKNALQRRVQELETDIRRLTVSYREVEAKASKDMERLRNHLIEIEESYTNEALVAQEREGSLVRTVNDLQQEVENQRHELQEVSVSTKRQRSELQEQLYSLATQRDNLVLQVAAAQEQVQQQSNAMNNLQRALEQFQRDKDTQHDLLTEQSRKELTKANQEIAELREKEKDYENRISEAKLAVQGVSNLSRQLEIKDTENDSLKEQISSLSGQIRLLEEEIQNSRVASENKLDKALVKNLMLGYFHTPANKRAEVVHVVGNLVGFSKDEIDQVGTGAPPVERGWVSSILPFGSGKGATPGSWHGLDSGKAAVNKSFTEAFVSFLEQESTASAKSQAAAPNKLTSLMISNPSASSTPLRSGHLLPQPSQAVRESSINPVTPNAAAVGSVNSSLLKPQSNPLLYSPRPVLFPAPGQEIPKVHTHTANSALKTMLSS